MSHAGARPRSGAKNTGERDRTQEARHPSRGRLLAEWVSLGISLVLILGVAGYLLYEALNQKTRLVVAEVTPRLEQTRHERSLYVVPIEVRNPGTHTLRNLKIEVTYTGSDGKEESRELEIDYLGEKSTQTLYVHLEEEPRAARLAAAPQSYRVE